MRMRVNKTRRPPAPGLDKFRTSPAACPQQGDDAGVPDRAWMWQATALAVAAVFLSLRGLSHGFLLLDDVSFIRDNPRVSQGWNLDNAAWALTAREERNWMPVSRWLYLLEMSWFGGWAGGYHLISAIMHGFGVWLCVWAWRQWTHHSAAALTAGAVFALHPLQVEAVAWITAQKDLLSAVFIFMALGCWRRNLRAESNHRWLWATYCAFAAALMAKPAVLSLPLFLMLALFERRPQIGATSVSRSQVAIRLIPLALLSTGAAGIMLWAAQSFDGVDTPEKQPWISFVHAPLGIVKYLGAFLWPAGLCSQHPIPRAAPVASASIALFVLAGVTVTAWRQRLGHRWIWLGWSWTLLMLLPSSGLIAFGPQGWGERFGYIAITGLGISLAGLLRAARVQPFHPAAVRRLGAVSMVACLIAGGMAVLFWRQQGYWRDSESLFLRTIEVEGDHGSSLLKLGTALAVQGRASEAASCWARAYENDPAFLPTRYNHACVLMAQRKFSAALKAIEPVVEGHPRWAEAHLVLANAMVENGRSLEAIAHYERAAALKPGLPTAARNAAILRERLISTPSIGTK